MTSNNPSRFSVPLYTVADAGHIVGVPSSPWRRGRRGTFAGSRTRPSEVVGQSTRMVRNTGRCRGGPGNGERCCRARLEQIEPLSAFFSPADIALRGCGGALADGFRESGRREGVANIG